MRTEDNLVVWRAVVEISRGLSLRDAAVALDMDVAALSRLITAFEKRIGAQLFDRSARPIRLSPLGEEKIGEIRRFVDLHADLLRSFGSASLNANRTVIRFGVVSGYPRQQLLPLLAQYQSSFNVDFEIATEVDHVDLMHDRVDVSYLLYQPDVPQLNSTLIHRLGVFPVASKEYVKRFGIPHHPRDLADHTILRRVGRNYPVADCLKKGEARSPIAAGSSLSGDFLTVRSAMLSGLGIAVDLPPASFMEELHEGRVVRVLDGWARPPFVISLAYLKQNADNAVLRHFCGWFRRHERLAALERYRRIGQPFTVGRNTLLWT